MSKRIDRKMKPLRRNDDRGDFECSRNDRPPIQSADTSVNALEETSKAVNAPAFAPAKTKQDSCNAANAEMSTWFAVSIGVCNEMDDAYVERHLRDVLVSHCAVGLPRPDLVDAQGMLSLARTLQ